MSTDNRPKFTPASLEVLDGYDPPIVGYLRLDGDVHVCDVIAQENDADTDGYANLFAAAPDLLAALQSLVTLHEQGQMTIDGEAGHSDPCIIEARAAIAKATRPAP